MRNLGHYISFVMLTGHLDIGKPMSDREASRASDHHTHFIYRVDFLEFLYSPDEYLNINMFVRVAEAEYNVPSNPFEWPYPYPECFWPQNFQQCFPPNVIRNETIIVINDSSVAGFLIIASSLLKKDLDCFINIRCKINCQYVLFVFTGRAINIRSCLK